MKTTQTTPFPPAVLPIPPHLLDFRLDTEIDAALLHLSIHQIQKRTPDSSGPLATTPCIPILNALSEQGNKHLIGPNPIRQQVNGSPIKVLMHLQPL